MASLIAERYRLGDVIGTGGMSEVYAAEDTLLGREVAIKMLRKDLALDANFRARFQREAQNAGRLNHPAIVAVYDTGEIEEQGLSTPYIVMELVHGQTLRDVIRNNGPLKPEVAAQDLIPVCQALQASHDAGIIHRDIKPGNIMITNTGAVKIMDFGIARALDDATSAMTQTSAVIGTAQYLSPEQARGKQVDGRSDIYALGCVLFEALTGKPPFEGDTPFSVAYQHVQEDPAHPSAFIEGLSPTAAINIDAVVLTAMAKHPNDRYQSAAEMEEELARLARHAITHAARPYLQAAKSGAALAGAAPATDAGVEPATVTMQSLPGQGPETTEVPAVQVPEVAALNQPASDMPAAAPGELPEEASEPSKRRWWVIPLIFVVILALGGTTYAFWRSAQNAASEVQVASVTIPDLAGTRSSEAMRTLEQLGLNVLTQDEPSPDVPAGSVISTNPSAGSSVQKGSTVILSVSSGKEVTTVPDLRDLNTEDASRALAEVGLQLNTVVQEVASDTVPEGLIVSQEPGAGSQVSVGSEVTITVSTGVELQNVPEVSGLQWNQASSILTSLGFSTNVVYVDSLEDEGTVLSVSNEGSRTPVTTVLQVQVSNGQLVNMPNIVGMTIPDALTALRAAGWQGSDDQVTEAGRQRSANPIDANRIAVQTPAEGEPVRRDQTIEVILFEFGLL